MGFGRGLGCVLGYLQRGANSEHNGHSYSLGDLVQSPRADPGPASFSDVPYLPHPVHFGARLGSPAWAHPLALPLPVARSIAGTQTSVDGFGQRRAEWARRRSGRAQGESGVAVHAGTLVTRFRAHEQRQDGPTGGQQTEEQQEPRRQAEGQGEINGLYKVYTSGVRPGPYCAAPSPNRGCSTVVLRLFYGCSTVVRRLFVGCSSVVLRLFVLCPTPAANRYALGS